MPGKIRGKRGKAKVHVPEVLATVKQDKGTFSLKFECAGNITKVNYDRTSIPNEADVVVIWRSVAGEAHRLGREYYKYSSRGFSDIPSNSLRQNVIDAFKKHWVMPAGADPAIEVVAVELKGLI